MNLRTLMGVGLLATMLAVTTGATRSQADSLRLTPQSAESGLQITLHQVSQITTTTTFAELVLADPQMADIVALGDQELMVLGKLPGRTTLALLDAKRDVLVNVPLEIHADLARFEAELDASVPASGIEVQSANFGLVLTGTVNSPEMLATALTLAESYAPGRVTDLLQLRSPQPVEISLQWAQIDPVVLKSLQASIAARAHLSTSEGTHALPLGQSAAQTRQLLSGLSAKGLLSLGEQADLRLMTGSSTTTPMAGQDLSISPQVASDGTVELRIAHDALNTPAELSLAPGHSMALTGLADPGSAQGSLLIITAETVDSTAVTQLNHDPVGIALQPGDAFLQN